MKKQKLQVYQEPVFRKIIIPSHQQLESKKTTKRKRKLFKKGLSQHKKLQLPEQKNYLEKFTNAHFFAQQIDKSQIHTLNQALFGQKHKQIISNALFKQRNRKSAGLNISKSRNFQNASVGKSRNCSSKKIQTFALLPKNDIRQTHWKNIQYSPYLKNPSDLPKLVKMLKPVKGPNQSIQKQILKYNDQHKKNHQLVLLRNSNQSFQSKRQKYLERIGLKSSNKLFIMNSRDHHIRQALLQRGWIELEDSSDSFFHLKWFYSDSLSQYENLNRGQLFNHFYNNQELTNKNNFRKNIKALPLQSQPSTALTFDLGISEQFKLFRQSALLFQGIKYLNMIINVLEVQDSKYFKRIMSNPNYFNFFNFKIQNKKNDDKDMSHKIFSNPNKSEEDQKLQSYLIDLISFLTKYITTQSSLKYSIFRSNRITNKKFNILDIFAYFEQIFLTKNNQLKLLLKISNFLKVQLIKIRFHFLTDKRLYEKSYGNQNVWIVKPVGVSRGTGIYLQPNYSKLLSQTNLQHGKLVQKYIQKPLLWKDDRKFDLRQWVLVKKFEPLQAYVFHKLYGRLCPQKYIQKDFQNVQRHLTNYSLSRNLYSSKKQLSSQATEQNQSVLFNHINLKKNNSTSIILEEDLERFVRKNKASHKVSWNQIRTKIELDIVKTLKGHSYKVEQNPNGFQIYGFDILIDENLHPFILQVNLSPACEKRQGLELYLEQMSHGLIDYIEEWINVTPTTCRKTIHKQQVWIKLEQQSLDKQLRQFNETKIKQQKASFIQKWIRNILKHQKGSLK